MSYYTQAELDAFWSTQTPVPPDGPYQVLDSHGATVYAHPDWDACAEFLADEPDVSWPCVIVEVPPCPQGCVCDSHTPAV